MVTWRTGILLAVLLSLTLWLLVYLLVVTGYRAVHETAAVPPDPWVTAASEGDAFVVDIPATTTTHTHPPRKAESRPTPTGDVWDRLAACESGGNWAINTGNGYFGGLQFSLGSWRAVGGQGYPHQASREEQISRAIALKGSGPFARHWPACSRKLRLDG